MNQDQTAPIRVHSACFYDKISLEYIRIYAADVVGRCHFLDKAILAGKGLRSLLGLSNFQK